MDRVGNVCIDPQTGFCQNTRIEAGSSFTLLQVRVRTPFSNWIIKCSSTAIILAIVYKFRAVTRAPLWEASRLYISQSIVLTRTYYTLKIHFV
jgi:hypothetical protein